MGSQALNFINQSGQTLAARIEHPEGLAKAYALLAHCFSGSKDYPAQSRISKALCQFGIGVMRFDFTGLGESSGDFSDTNFSSNVSDIHSAAEFLRTNHMAPKILIGHSLGGAAVLKAARGIPEVKAVATIGAPSNPEHIEHLFGAAKADIEQKGEAEIVLAGRKFKIKKQFLEDIAHQVIEEEVKNLSRALLIFHSPFDKTVSIDHARKIYEMAKHPKSFISLDEADHLLTKREDAEYVALTLAAWASRYIIS